MRLSLACLSGRLYIVGLGGGFKMTAIPNRPRPLLRYHGGKFRMADWIISQMPKQRFYLVVQDGRISKTYGGLADMIDVFEQVQQEKNF